MKILPNLSVQWFLSSSGRATFCVCSSGRMEDVPVPDEITCDDQVFDIDFHSRANVVAVGLIDGSVDIWSYGLEENRLLFKNTFHESSCRGVAFSSDGEVLYSISSDMSLQAVDGNGQQRACYKNAHDTPINKIINIADNILATGDDSGVVKLWDVRTPNGEVANWHQHEDFVSGFTFHPESNTLLSVGGDAMLCMYDLRDTKNIAKSDDQEAELHCVEVIKGGKKVLCGSEEGVMLVFSWGKWGDCSDRFPGHPQTIDCMLKVDESTVITGSSDGLIRVVAIHPNKVLGVIGDHDGFPVEGIRASNDRKYLGSYSHDEVVRFWDISMFTEDDGTEFDEDQDSDEEGEKDPNSNAKMSGDKQKSSSKGKIKKEDTMVMDDVEDDDDEENWEDASDSDEEEGEEEGAVMDDSENDEDDSDSDDSSEDEVVNRRKKLPTKAEKFYSDL